MRHLIQAGRTAHLIYDHTKATRDQCLKGLDTRLPMFKGLLMNACQSSLHLTNAYTNVQQGKGILSTNACQCSSDYIDTRLPMFTHNRLRAPGNL